MARWKKLGLQPSPLCSDAVFVRRVYLDVIGTLPTAAEAREFLLDRNPDKRRALIDRLLERDERADYWAMKWSDVLRIKAEFPINLWPNAAQAYYHWIRTSIRENKPYDRFARELLTSSGSNFRVPPVNFYRALQSRQPDGHRPGRGPGPDGRAGGEVAARTPGRHVGFLREDRLQIDRRVERGDRFLRSEPDARQSDEIRTLPARPAAPIFPDGTAARIPPDRDPREVFADWLIDVRNPWFARNIVNRAMVLARTAAASFTSPTTFAPTTRRATPNCWPIWQANWSASHYDLKHVDRLILNSKTYQLSSLARGNRPEAEANFAFYPLRRLEAEVLIDAICQVTGTTEKYSSAIPEPYTFLPEGHRSIALPDGSITSPFLETFGRPPRDTGLASERNNRVTAAQRLHMLNSTHIQRKLEQSPRIQELLAPAAGTIHGWPRQLIASLYLTHPLAFPHG